MDQYTNTVYSGIITIMINDKAVVIVLLQTSESLQSFRAIITVIKSVYMYTLLSLEGKQGIMHTCTNSLQSSAGYIIILIIITHDL